MLKIFCWETLENLSNENDNSFGHTCSGFWSRMSVSTILKLRTDVLSSCFTYEWNRSEEKFSDTELGVACIEKCDVDFLLCRSNCNGDFYCIADCTDKARVFETY